VAATNPRLGFAFCDDHAVEALTYLEGHNVRVRSVAGIDGYTCRCRKPAAWYLRELEAREVSA